MTQVSDLNLEELSAEMPDKTDNKKNEVAKNAIDNKSDGTKTAADLEALFDVRIKVTGILGKAKLSIGELSKLSKGSVIKLDRKVGEAIDIYANNRLIARGEVVLVEDKLGITMTEIVKEEAQK